MLELMTFDTIQFPIAKEPASKAVRWDVPTGKSLSLQSATTPLQNEKGVAFTTTCLIAHLMEPDRIQ